MKIKARTGFVVILVADVLKKCAWRRAGCINAINVGIVEWHSRRGGPLHEGYHERQEAVVAEGMRGRKLAACSAFLRDAAANVNFSMELRVPLFELPPAFVAACWLADIRRSGPTRRVEAPSSLCLVACCNEGAQLEV